MGKNKYNRPVLYAINIKLYTLLFLHTGCIACSLHFSVWARYKRFVKFAKAYLFSCIVMLRKEILLLICRFGNLEYLG
jgi:hypothetical protein